MKELTTFAMNACTTVFQLGTLANVALTSGNIEDALTVMESVIG